MKFLKKPLRLFRRRSKRRIYIVPTLHGLLFLGLAIFCILIAATYGSNLVNLLAFILLGIFIVAAQISNSYLKNIDLERVDVSSHYVNQKGIIRLLIKNRSLEAREGIQIELGKQLDKKWKDFSIEPWVLPPQELKSIQGTLSLSRRGQYFIHQIKIFTTRPLGLFYVWSQVPVNVEFFVYPEPKGQEVPFDFIEEGSFEKNSSRTQTPEDFYQHRLYQEGESLGRVDWKALARGRPKLIKEFQIQGGRQWNLDWNQVHELNLELKLSQFSMWLKQAQEKKIKVQFQHPRIEKIGVVSQSDFDRCLSVLATEPNRDEGINEF
ncbi:MAG TPA: DUF58 domain-containing protein [Pseudobdellovibrionaceae bacterium]|nr:DUF58 domain-containing protein [Pseudobdellovibrionaceae bacterium]